MTDTAMNPEEREEPRWIQRTVHLSGIVQGVGMRPTLQRLATKAGLGGWVQNLAGSVHLSLRGEAANIQRFLQTLPEQLPDNARLDTLSDQEIKALPLSARHTQAPFIIRASAEEGTPCVAIPADLAGCRSCMAEVLDPTTRRYGYPFTTCTQCGPRYTVIHALPYDRERTTLAPFSLCNLCHREYTDPENRRFHAESISCPTCGPRLSLVDGGGTAVEGDPIRASRDALHAGKIIAMRWVGGFQLVVDAQNQQALHTLRTRKDRPHKPLAVMARDIATLRRYSILSSEAEQLLCGPVAPIVILDTPQKNPWTPDAQTLGAMLPTTPLHRLLFEPLEGDPTPPFELLVITSGNRRSEPVCLENEEARSKLADVADLFLYHDQAINLHNDDSLCIFHGQRAQVWRRARGFAPQAFTLQKPLAQTILAMGSDLKNTMAIGFHSEVVLSPHIGDLKTAEARHALEKMLVSLPKFLQKRPKKIAVDRHPDMYATILGHRQAQAWSVPVVAVQHHHAHAAACMAEHGLEESLALVLDGNGWGPDQTLWGAELLHLYPGGYERLGTFAGIPLPGADQAVRCPARQLIARFLQAEIPVTDDWRRRLSISETESKIWSQQCRTAINAPTTHAAGRLFDAFATLLGLAPKTITYEGQAAVRLESAARRDTSKNHLCNPIPYTLREQNRQIRVDWAEAFRFLAFQPMTTETGASWAMACHHAIARSARDMIEYACDRIALRHVVLSGGVFMNRILTEQLLSLLQEKHLKVFIHRDIPPNDGGIALGQAWVVGTDPSQ